MRALNRHYTSKWKRKRKNRHGDRCGNAKCMICHADKVLHKPTIHERKMNERINANNKSI